MRKALLAAAIAGLAIVLYAAAGYWLAPRFVRDALIERAARLGLALELGEVRTNPFSLTLSVDGARVLADGRELARAQRFGADLAWSSLWSDAWRLQAAALHEPWAEVELGPQGELNWPAARNASAGEAAEPRLAWLIEQLTVQGGALRFVDRSRAAPVEIRFEAIELRADGLSTRQGERGRYELQARTAQGGALSSEGSLALDPLSAQGKLSIADVALETVWSLAAPASEPGSGQIRGSAAYAYDGEQLVLSEVTLEGTRLAHAGVELSQLVLRAPRIALPVEAPFEASATARVAPEGTIHASGRIGIAPFSADLQAQAEGLPLAQANPWLPEDAGVQVASGRLDADGRLAIEAQGARYEGALALREARLEERGSGELLVAWDNLETGQAALSFAPFRAELGEVLAQAPTGRLVLDGTGGEARSEARPPVSVERLRVERGALQLSHPEVALAVRDIEGEVAGFSTTQDEPARIELRNANVVLPDEEPIPVRASGTIATQPFAAALQVHAEGVPLAQANRWLPESVALNIVSGRLAVDGQVVWDEAGARYEGSLAVRDARIEERASGDLLLAWESLRTDEAALSLDPFRAQLGEVVARAPAGRLVIEETGQLNFAAVVSSDKKGADDAPKTQVAVRRLRIENGTLDFADRSLENDFAVTVAELSGTVTGFSTEPGNPARVQLSGRVGDYGAARIGGTVNLDQPTSLTNIRANFRNLDLAALTPYVVRFAGYRVESGRVSAELRYRVRQGRLVGENDLTFEKLQLGDKVRGAGVRDLPLELVVALLADAKGRINLDIPVSGDLNDPQFDFGGLIARALGNVVGKIASAPFRVLAGVFGKGGENLDRVAFAPGSASLTPPAEETVAQVAKALAERPRLDIAVQGGYDPQADLEALRRDTARRAIAQRAGVEGRGPLDFTDPKVLQAAERLYLERVGNRLQMLELREKEPRYPRALLQALAGTLQVDAQSVETLARARAETVRAALLSHGVEPSRVRLDAPDSREAGKEGVPTVLALDTGRSAAAGGTR
ncbi:MAG TPA: DUF748 domain-containing protein [Burkholderiales bacterium]